MPEHVFKTAGLGTWMEDSRSILLVDHKMVNLVVLSKTVLAFFLFCFFFCLRVMLILFFGAYVPLCCIFKGRSSFPRILAIVWLFLSYVAERNIRSSTNFQCRLFFPNLLTLSIPYNYFFLTKETGRKIQTNTW